MNAAQHVVPLTLELGGKGANIIFEDANLQRAIQGRFQASSRPQGRRASRARACSYMRRSMTRCSMA